MVQPRLIARVNLKLVRQLQREYNPREHRRILKLRQQFRLPSLSGKATESLSSLSALSSASSLSLDNGTEDEETSSDDSWAEGFTSFWQLFLLTFPAGFFVFLLLVSSVSEMVSGSVT